MEDDHRRLRSMSRLRDGVVAALVAASVIVTMYRHRDHSILSPVTSAVASYRLTSGAVATWNSPSAQTYLLFFKPSECGGLLEMLAALGDRYASGEAMFVAVAIGDDDSTAAVEGIFRRERIRLPVAMISERSALAIFKSHAVRRTPALFLVRGRALESRRLSSVYSGDR